MTPLKINFKRLQKNLEELGRIGRGKDNGIYRMCFSDGEMEARAWLKKKIEDAGLEYSEDSATNIVGRLTDSSINNEPVVMTGSHIDSVPGAGQLDGALGVVAGLETLLVLKEQGKTSKRPVELIAFADEEGRFGGMLGSRAISGKLTPETIFEARDLEGNQLQEVMKNRGYEALDALKAARNPEEIHSFVELHIEQGPILDRKEIGVGVVEGIAGLFKWQVRFLGTSNHSGTTPMDMRVDAFQGVAELAREVNRLLDENGSPQSVCNIGRIELKPGAPNVVPGFAEFSLEVRDIDGQILGDLAYAFRRAMSAIARRRELMFEFDVLSEIPPVKCDRSLVQLITKTTKDLGLENLSMFSGAAHDCQNMAGITRAAMIFVPSKDGKSHSPAEWTDWRDIEKGANVLLNTVGRLAND